MCSFSVRRSKIRGQKIPRRVSPWTNQGRPKYNRNHNYPKTLCVWCHINRHLMTHQMKTFCVFSVLHCAEGHLMRHPGAPQNWKTGFHEMGSKVVVVVFGPSLNKGRRKNGEKSSFSLGVRIWIQKRGISQCMASKGWEQSMRLTEAFGKMSAGRSGRNLPLWADFSFLIVYYDCCRHHYQNSWSKV